MIRVEHAQSEAMRTAITPAPADHWRPYAQGFRADPRRTGDEFLDAILETVPTDETLIDVGAGGGRLALPLALRCRHVTAVEPSPSMAEVLETAAHDHSITNILVVQARWEDALVEPAGLALSVHVLYVVPEVEGFIRKMEAHASRRVMIVLHQAPPQSQIYPLWAKVHGEERLALPSVPELREVLNEMGIDFQEEALPVPDSNGYESPQQALEQISQRLYLAENDPKRERLRHVLTEDLEQHGGGFRIRGSKALQPVLISWSPAKAP
jgi:cyclopropane fatty-acyl-phospholipid synthase-like methyltransferase